jgi:N-acetylmuramoyl-L-alanine amidase
VHKVYLSPSLQTANTYVYPPGGNEAQHTRTVADWAARFLRDDGRFAARLSAKSWASPDGVSGLANVVADSNRWGADLHIPIHSNAAAPTADGTITFHLAGSPFGRRFAQLVQTAVGKVSPGSDYGIRPMTGWTELYARAVVAYVELGFHSNKVEAGDIVKRPQAYGWALYAACCRYYSLHPSD